MTDAPIKIETKAQMLDLLRRGLLGNTVQTWESPDQVPENLRRSRRFGIRYRTIGNQKFILNQTYPELAEKWTGDPDAYVSESLPVEEILWQAQVTRNAQGWYLEHSTETAAHRAALLSGYQCASGRTALALLRLNLDAASFDDLMGLFDQYDAFETSFTVELSCFCRSYGVLNRPTIIWEARHY